MPDEFAIRRRRLREILRDRGGTIAELAERLGGRNPSYLSNLLAGRKNLGGDMAREYERLLRLPPYWLDGAEVSAIPDLDAEEKRLLDAYRALRASPQSDIRAALLEQFSSLINMAEWSVGKRKHR